MIGMLAGSAVMDFEKGYTKKESRKVLLEAYEGMEVFGLRERKSAQIFFVYGPPLS